MNNISIIGLGDMGSDLAKNLMANGFSVFGLDLKPERQAHSPIWAAPWWRIPLNWGVGLMRPLSW